MFKDFVMVLAVILLLGIGSCAAAADHQWDRQWDNKEVALGVTALALHVIDWKQTQMIVKTPGYYEQNLLLGKHPSMSAVNTHFLISGLLVAGLAHFVPEYRKEILSVYVVVQTVNTVRNYSIGLRVKF